MAAEKNSSGHSIMRPREAGFNPDDIFDLLNPRSMINLVPPAVRDALLNPDLPRAWLELRENELMKRVQSFIDPRDHRLRLNFWDEYNLAQDENRVMNIKRICRGAASEKYFYYALLTERHKLIFLLYAPAAYQVAIKELLQIALAKMREVMSLSITDMKGRPNVQLIAQMAKIFQIVDARVQGAPRQQLDINQQSLHVTGSMHDVARFQAPRQVDQLDTEIKALEQELSLNSAKEEIMAHAVTLPAESDD